MSCRTCTELLNGKFCNTFEVFIDEPEREGRGCPRYARVNAEEVADKIDHTIHDYLQRLDAVIEHHLARADAPAPSAYTGAAAVDRLAWRVGWLMGTMRDMAAEIRDRADMLRDL